MAAAFGTFPSSSFDAGRSWSGSGGPGVHGRSEDERPVDRVGNARDFQSAARGESVAARSANNGRDGNEGRVLRIVVRLYNILSPRIV